MIIFFRSFIQYTVVQYIATMYVLITIIQIYNFRNAKTMIKISKRFLNWQYDEMYW